MPELSARRPRLLLLDDFGPAEVQASLLDAVAAGAPITASLVVSTEGEFTGSQGSSKELSDPTDRLWLSALRRRSEVVITSGKTFRVERYAMPKTADLAILSRSKLELSHLEPKSGQRLHVLAEQRSYLSAVWHLGSLGYRRIHVEFGPAGIGELIRSNLEFTLFLSGSSFDSIHRAGALLGAKVTDLAVVNGLCLAKAR